MPAQAADDVAAWAPKDALLYLGVPDCDRLVESAKKTKSYAATKDPALEDTGRPFVKLFENGQALLAKSLGLESPKALEVYPHGGLAAFMSASPPPNEGDEPTPHLGLVMDMGKDLDAAKRLADKIVQKCLEKNGRKDESEIRGCTVTTIRFKKTEPEDADTDGASQPIDTDALFEDVNLDEITRAGIEEFVGALEAPEEFALAFSGSRLIVGSDTQTVKAAITRLKQGRDATLATDAAIRSLKRRCAEDAPVQFVINLPRVWDLIGGIEPDAKKMIRALGAPALGAIVMTIEVAPSPKVEMRMRGFMSVAAERSGLGKILMMDNIDSAVTTRVFRGSARRGGPHVVC